MIMEYKNFTKAITAYKAGNSNPLEEIIHCAKEIDSSEWYYLGELIQEQKAFNIPIGDYYMIGTLGIFQEALSKIDPKSGRISFDKKTSINLLAEDPGEFSGFLSNYVDKAVRQHDYDLCSTLLGLNTGKPEKIWESFFNNFLDSFELDDFEDKGVKNIAVNVNHVIDIEKSQHKKIMKAIEFDVYPEGNIFEQMLNYVIDFDKYLLPKNNLNRMGRNEEYMIKCKKIANILQKVELENELAHKDNNGHMNINKIKPNKV